MRGNCERAPRDYPSRGTHAFTLTASVIWRYQSGSHPHFYFSAQTKKSPTLQSAYVHIPGENRQIVDTISVELFKFLAPFKIFYVRYGAYKLS